MVLWLEHDQKSPECIANSDSNCCSHGSYTTNNVVYCKQKFIIRSAFLNFIFVDLT
jgi:hypothetical protein